MKYDKNLAYNPRENARLVNPPPHPVTLDYERVRQIKRSLTGKSEAFNNPISNDVQELHHTFSKLCPIAQYFRFKKKDSKRKICTRNMQPRISVRASYLGISVTSLSSRPASFCRHSWNREIRTLNIILLTLTWWPWHATLTLPMLIYHLNTMALYDQLLVQLDL